MKLFLHIRLMTLIVIYTLPSIPISLQLCVANRNCILPRVPWYLNLSIQTISDSDLSVLDCDTWIVYLTLLVDRKAY